MSVDTIAFTQLRQLAGVDFLLRGLPSNACFAVIVADSEYRWAWKARWTPGPADTVRLQVFRSPDAAGDVTLALKGDSVRGVEVSTADGPHDGPVATVPGRRIGDADATWCAEIQMAYFRTHNMADMHRYLRDATTPWP